MICRYCYDLTITDMLKGKNKKQAHDYQGGFCSVKNPQYATRFEDALRSLQFRLTNLEQNLNLVNEQQDKQKVVLNILTEIRNTKEEIRNNETNLQCSRKMPSIRSYKVPASIQNNNVWNDCWYDEKRKAYVTHNEYFKKIPDIHETEHQQKYDQEIGDGGIVVREFKVEFRFGYPACKMHYTDGSSVWFLIPTMTDDMLTKEIVKARLMPESQEEAILYETQSESWIEIGTGKLVLTEREYELGKDSGRYTYAPIEAVKALFNRK